MKLRSQNLMRMKQASKIQHVLRDVDIQKASSLFDIDEATLHRLNDQFLLNVEYIREELIKHDWNKLVKGLKYLVDQNQGYTYPEVSKAVCDNTTSAVEHLRISSRATIIEIWCSVKGVAQESQKSFMSVLVVFAVTALQRLWIFN